MRKHARNIDRRLVGIVVKRKETERVGRLHKVANPIIYCDLFRTLSTEIRILTDRENSKATVPKEAPGSERGKNTTIHHNAFLVSYIKYPCLFYYLLVASLVVVSEMRVGRPIS
jgi:hypothetical protein